LLTVGTGAVTNGGYLLTVDGSGNTTISSVISGTGAGGITKAGAGILTLSGNNTFAGQLTVQTGTLSIASINNDNSAGRLGQSTLPVILGSSGQTGTLQYTAGTASSSKKFTMAAGGTGAFDVSTAATTLTLSGVIDGATGNLTKTGVGTLALSAATGNTYGGTTTVSGGVLQLNHATAIPGGIGSSGGTSGLTLAGGVLGLDIGDFARGLGTGVDQVQFTGSGGFAAYTADRAVNLGGASAGVTWDSGNFVPAGSALILGAGTATHTVDFQNPIDLNGADRTIQVDNGAAAIDGKISGAISSTGGGGIVKTGAGTLLLSGGNSYSGSTTVSAGGLVAATAASLPGYNSSGLVVFNGGMIGVQVGGSGWATGDVDTLLANATKTSGALGIDTTNGDVTQWTAFTPTNMGSLGLTKLGSNALILNQTNTYTGPTTVSAGTLQLTDTGALASSSGLTLATGTTLALRSDTTATFTMPTTTVPVSATVTIDVNNNGSGSGNTLTMSGGLRLVTPTANTKINVTGGNNGYVLNVPTFTYDQTGASSTLTFNPTSAAMTIGTLAHTWIGSAALLTLDGTSTGNSIASHTGTWLQIDKSNTSTWTVNLTGSQPTRVYLKPGNSGNLIVNGTIKTMSQNASSGVRVEGGVLHYNNAGAVDTSPGANSALRLVNGSIDNSSGAPITTSTYNPIIEWNGNWTFVGSNGANSDLNLGTGAVTMSATRTVTMQNAAATLSVGGVISGAGGLTKAGPGTLKLSGASKYTGATTIQAGGLVAGANSLASTDGAFGNAGSAIVLGNGSTGAGDAPAVLISGAFTVGRAITVGSVTNTAAYNATIGGSNTGGTSTYTGNITLNTTAANYTATLQAAAGGAVEFNTGTWATNDKAIAVGSPGNTGTVVLSNAIATAGGINVNYGALALNSALTGNMTVASGAKLAGNGTISGLVTAAGSIAPGSSIDTLTVGSLTLNSATLDFEWGTGNDKIIVSNTDGLAINSGTLNLFNTSGGQWLPTAGIYDLISYQGSVTGSASSLAVGNPNSLYTYTLGTDHAGWITVNIQSVPTGFEWLGGGDNTWNTASQWEGGVAPGAGLLTVNLGKVSSSGTVNLNSQTPTLAVTLFRSAVGTTISGPGTITLDNGGSGATVTVDSGASHTIGSGVSVVLADNATINAGGGLTIAGPITESGGPRSITKDGLGTLTLSGDNSYTGGTSLNLGGSSRAAIRRWAPRRAPWPSTAARSKPLPTARWPTRPPLPPPARSLTPSATR
jgi:autotransporter-associated beta strand protein